MFYDRLKEACTMRGEKVTPLIAELGMSRGNLASWKDGNVPKADTLGKLAARLNVSVDYLLEKTDDPSPATGQPEDKITILARNARKLTPEEQEKLYDVARTLFKKAFEENE